MIDKSILLALVINQGHRCLDQCVVSCCCLLLFVVVAMIPCGLLLI
jgi:hypothetical protein